MMKLSLSKFSFYGMIKFVNNGSMAFNLKICNKLILALIKMELNSYFHKVRMYTPSSFIIENKRRLSYRMLSA